MSFNKFDWKALVDKPLLHKHASIKNTEGTYRLTVNPNEKKSYRNAQIDDYRNLKRKEFKWTAPLVFSCSAKLNCEDTFKGTLGFGFWNDPFLMTGWRIPSLPQALWFILLSKPSSFPTSVKAEAGLKAMSLNAKTITYLLCLPFQLLMMPFMTIKKIRDTYYPFFLRKVQANETPLNINLKEWHDFKIKWLKDKILFYIDGDSVAVHKLKLKSPQGLVIWIDNQYLSLKPNGILKWGSLALEHEQSLELKDVHIKSLQE